MDKDDRTGSSDSRSRRSTRAPRKPRSTGSGNRVLGRTPATAAENAGTAPYTPPTADSPPPTARGGDRPVADAATEQAGAVRGADSPDARAPGEAEARTAVAADDSMRDDALIRSSGDGGSAARPAFAAAEAQAAAGPFADRRERWLRIAEAAYFRAQQRGFEPGHEVDDWLAAEREIEAREAGRQP